jgi:3-hydroxyacyl-[acyl-carrier-protein] dehydratase
VAGKIARVRNTKDAPKSIIDLGLPHRLPFVFVRELIACNPGVSAECATTFAGDDPIFAGHFPGNPLVPGVILTEALAQTAGIAAAAPHAENAGPLFLLSAIRGMKFFHAVGPEERIVLRAEKVGEIGDLFQFKVAADVDGKRVAEGELVLSKATATQAAVIR